MSLKKHKVVVVGNGMVIVRFCQRPLDYDKNGRFHITMLGKECRPAYDRVQLTSFCEKESADELILEPAAWYEEIGQAFAQQRFAAGEPYFFNAEFGKLMNQPDHFVERELFIFSEPGKIGADFGGGHAVGAAEITAVDHDNRRSRSGRFKGFRVEDREYQAVCFFIVHGHKQMTGFNILRQCRTG